MMKQSLDETKKIIQELRTELNAFFKTIAGTLY